MIALQPRAHFQDAPTLVEAAILRAILYADVFDYPLTEDEIHRYLCGEAVSPESVRAKLTSSEWLAGRLSHVGNLYALAGRESLIKLRAARADASARLWPMARRFGALLAHLPFVRMVAVTGALAVNNAQANDDGVANGDDIDYLIVTTPGRVWLARAMTIAVVRLARLCNVALCPNYLLAETHLAQDQRDLFIAHELAQMIPLAGHEAYWRMRAANGWAADFLPNAATIPRPETDSAPRGFGRLMQGGAERSLSGFVGEALERWERRRKLRKFQPQLDQPRSAAVLDESRVKGHFDDYGWEALRRYAARCAKYGIECRGAGEHEAFDIVNLSSRTGALTR